MKIKEVLITYIKHEGQEHNRTLDIVENVVDQKGLFYVLCERDNLKTGLIKNKNLIITVGGDGTFLRTSHFVDNQLMFGVNSDPNTKEGFFTTATKNDFEKKLDRVLKGKYGVVELGRICGLINNAFKTEPAVNEVYFGSEKSYHTSIYEIKIKNRKETQKSSGVLIGTAAGSSAWTKSAGGKLMPLSSNKMQYLVREPYPGRTAKTKLTRGLINARDIKITAKRDAVVVVDSTGQEYHLKGNDTLKVVKAKKLRFVKF